jgi:hypothetical protein
MKRNKFYLLLFTVLFLVFLFPVYAGNTNTFKLDELDMSIELPSDFVVFTRDINPNDPNLSTYELTKDSLSSYMTSNNIYLYAWDKDINYDIFITMIDSPLKDYNGISDTTLSTLATGIESEYESAGITYIKSEIYQQSQAKFLKIYSSQPDGESTIYGLEYHTVYAGKVINVSMQSYSGQITSENEATLKSIVDSVKFGTEPQVKEIQLLSTDAFEYTDSETQTSFTVPANWSEKEILEDSEFIDVNFGSNKEEGLCILYGSTDAYGKLTDSERAEYSRSDMDNSMLTKDDIAEMYEIPTSQIEIVTYGDFEYYKVEMKTQGTENYAIFSITTTRMVRVDNGYLYWFQFNGPSDSQYYADFESMLESVRYPQSSNSSSDYSNLSIETVLLSLIITIVIYSMPIMIYRYAIRKASVDPHTAKKITIIYGIAAFIVMSILIFALHGSKPAGIAIIFWSYVNYRMLVSGKSVQTDGKDTTVPDGGAEDDATEVEQTPNVTQENSENNDNKNSES